jgi:hypothetical protein
VLDVDRALQQTELGDHLADLGKVAPELQDRRGIGPCDPGRESFPRQGRGQDHQGLGEADQRSARRGGRCRERYHARYDLGGVAIAQSVEQMGKGAVNERIALAEDSDVMALLQLRADPRGAFVVRRVSQLRVRLHGQCEVNLRTSGRQVLGRNPACDAWLAARRDIGDHRTFLQDADRLQGQQLGVARPDTDAEQPAGDHGLRAAS